MTIPDFQRIMLPLLKFAADGEEHSASESYNHIAGVFNLSDEERRQLLPSGPMPMINNRTGWARTYLTKAGLLEPTRRAHFRITDLGRQVLADEPPDINLRFLRQFPGVVEFTRGRGAGDEERASHDDDVLASRTPQELMEYGSKRIQAALSEELLGLVKRSSPQFFERLVVELLLKMGYGGSRTDAGEAIGRSGDGGIDGIIKEDKLGLDVIYIQAKRWENNVSSPEIRNFVGSLVGHNANKGVFLTTSDFTKDARDYAKTIGHNVILVDGVMLAGLMIDHDVGVSTIDRYEVKRADADYFEEE
ncbi:MAG: restriction endonuclease [Dehalococcoidia bacterium]